ncbi:MAG: cytochrome c biogenesis protein CcsA [Vampirovibrionales bacterium]|nr:cytochrome c biogenesis protein CcsA [Vampirovibrionales bacterium]
MPHDLWRTLPALTALLAAIWGAGLWLFHSERPQRARWGLALNGAGVALLGVWIIALWTSMDRPPLRTLGETRLMYALMLPLIAIFLSRQWRLRWPMLYAVALSLLFLVITALHPETLDKTLMPALQSVWFIPHVTVYLLAYAFLTLGSVVCLPRFARNDDALRRSDEAIGVGFALLTLGLLFGAFWAKEAWGHYWTWDPKETWAFLTWAAYLTHLHLRARYAGNLTLARRFLAGAFLALLLCWFGVNYLPSARQSVHTYSQP